MPSVSNILKACKNPRHFQQVHTQNIRRGLEQDNLLIVSLVAFMVIRNLGSWLLMGYLSFEPRNGGDYVLRLREYLDSIGFSSQDAFLRVIFYEMT